MHDRILTGLIALLAGSLLLTSHASAAEGADWPSFGRDAGGSQFSPLTQINPSNVTKLRVAWTHRSGDFVDEPFPKGTVFQATPLHVNGSLYYCTPLNRVFALDPATGSERWVFDPHQADASGKPLIKEARRASRCRGVAYWQVAEPVRGRACEKRIFKSDPNGHVYALDADTGRSCSDFGAATSHPGYVSHLDHEGYGEGGAGMSSPPVILGDLVIAGSGSNDGLTDPRDGVVRAWDVRTGELRWEFNPIPADKRRLTGAANVWSTMSVDTERGLVFAPTTSPATDYYGGGRRFEIPLANSIVAINGGDGSVAWSFQTVRHDLFDYDLVGHPLLVDIRRGGKRIPAALLQTKMGWVFAFDRATGAPLWPIVDRAVPASDVPGELAAKTQPAPTGIAAFARQELKREDLFGLTPIDRAWCQRRFDELRYDGIYTPPSIRGSVLFPSALGGGNWGGAAYDPGSNLLIIKAENLATVIKVVAKQDPAAEDKLPPKDYLTRPLQGTPYRVEGELFSSPLGVPCTPPPWGTLAAIDMDTGKLRWKIPLGQVRRAGINAPESLGWGSPNVGGPILTASGLTFIAATMDSKIRAFETRTGRELWQSELPAPGMAVPMTYAVQGRQYLVIAAGGNAMVETRISDAVVAYTLAP